MQEKPNRMKTFKPFAPLLLFLLSYLLISSNIGNVSIYILDEAKNASCAREMMETGNYIVPTFNYELRTDKPPLHYYFMIFGYKLFGVNEFGARFFSVFFGCTTVLFTFFFAKKYFNFRTALLSCIILLSSLHYVLQFHLAVPDPYLIFFIVSSLFLFYSYHKEQKVILIYLFYVSLALGTLAKGPVAIVLPGLIILSHLILTKQFNWKKLASLRIIQGGLLYLIIALPWFIMVHLQTNGEWTTGFFLTHNMERFTSTMEGHGGSFYYPILFLFLGMLPFVVFIVPTSVYSWKNLKNELILFLSLIVAWLLIFFAVSKTQLPNYIVPLYPAFAILTANYLDTVCSVKQKVSLSIRVIMIVYLFLMTAIPVGAYFGLSLEPMLMHLKWESLYFIILPIGALFSMYFALVHRIRPMIISIASSWMVMSLLFFFVVYPSINSENPVERSRHFFKNDVPVAHFRRMNSAFAFTLKKPISKLYSFENVAEFLNKNSSGLIITTKKIYSNNQEIFDSLNAKIVFEHRDLYEIPTTVIITRDDKNSDWEE